MPNVTTTWSPDDLVYPGLTPEDCADSELYAGSISPREWPRAKAVDYYASEYCVSAMHVVCEPRFIRFLTLRDSWENGGMDDWEDAQFDDWLAAFKTENGRGPTCDERAAAPWVEAPSDPPYGWHPGDESEGYEFCDEASKDATPVWLCQEKRS